MKQAIYVEARNLNTGLAYVKRLDAEDPRSAAYAGKLVEVTMDRNKAAGWNLYQFYIYSHLVDDDVALCRPSEFFCGKEAPYAGWDKAAVAALKLCEVVAQDTMTAHEVKV
jgi:hypothetical protein